MASDAPAESSKKILPECKLGPLNSQQLFV
jgi:hypothetical protein